MKDRVAAVARFWPWMLAAAAVIIAPLIFIGYSYEWTGFGEYTRTSGEVIRAKTLWEWLELLIIPVTLLVGGYLLNKAEKRRDDEKTAQRIEEDRRIAEQHIQEEREIAEERTQETALQTYLDQMAELLIEKALSSTPTPETQDVARVWTLTVVRRVNAERKGIVLQFLHESKLIRGDAAIVSLVYANLSGANLSWADLNGANLSWANLNGANLSDANLIGANLNGADLSGANLSRAFLNEAILVGANLSGANLSKTDLSRAELSGTDLSQALLSGAILSGSTYSEDTRWPSGFDYEQAGVRFTGNT
jgi:uncharacterized protein YjbI with pentapeptide repeats